MTIHLYEFSLFEVSFPFLILFVGNVSLKTKAHNVL